MCIPTGRFNCTMYMYYFNFIVNDTWRFIDWKKKPDNKQMWIFLCWSTYQKKIGTLFHQFAVICFLWYVNQNKNHHFHFINQKNKLLLLHDFDKIMTSSILNCLGHDIVILTAEMHQHQFGYSEVKNQLCVKICIKG